MRPVNIEGIIYLDKSERLSLQLKGRADVGGGLRPMSFLEGRLVSMSFKEVAKRTVQVS